MTVAGLPWHEAQWSLIDRQVVSGRRPHALLLAGPANLGKVDFARALAARLLCRKEGAASACGECSSCHLLHAGTHPDFVEVTPLESKQIKVDQIRELTDWASQTSGGGGDKIALIHPAEQMNLQSSNALLKCLEEPASDTLIILVSNQPTRLLPTIRSRCQTIAFGLPSHEVAASWLTNAADNIIDPAQALAIAGGSPLRVLREIDDDYLTRRTLVLKVLASTLRGDVSALEAVSRLAKHEAGEVLRVLQLVVDDAIKHTMSLSVDWRVNKDAASLIESFAESDRLDLLFDIADRTASGIRDLESTANPNPQLLLESLFVLVARVAHQ
ncbi:MAG: DNA polymerase III subunit delta' [Proteobacteria bacterium]|nr:DNA polymerase III subunit delta' [Pseudomonadota bacterium]